MSYSWKLGRLGGIDVFLHWSFSIVPAWVALTSLAAGAALTTAVSATFFAASVGQGLAVCLCWPGCSATSTCY